jgi:hypothetical protein
MDEVQFQQHGSRRPDVGSSKSRIRWLLQKVPEDIDG